MLVPRRRTAAALLVAGLVGLSVLAGTSGASAFSTPPPPITFPPSAVPSGLTSGSGSLSPAQWDSYLKAHPELVPTSTTPGAAAGKVGVSGAGGVATAVGGFLVGTQLGSGIASTLGLPTSGNFFCDLGTLLGTSDCAASAASVYIPDSDVAGSFVPGYSVTPVLGINGNTGWSTTAGTMTLGPLAAAGGLPAYNAGPGSYPLTVPLSLAGSCTPGESGGWAPILMWQVFYTDGTSSSTDAVNYINGPLGVNCANPSADAVPFTVVIEAGKSFDHLLLRNTSGAPTAGGVGQLNWYPEGHADRPAEPDAHPSRSWRTTWSCTSGPGGVASSAAFLEADASWPSVPQPSCASGVVSAITVEQLTGGTGSTLYDWTLPAEVGTAATDYPDCAGATPCQLLLSRLASATDTATVSCFSNPSICADWWTETSAGTATETDTDYRCSYGPYPLDLSACAAYSHAFDDGVLANPATGEAPSGSPATDPGDSSCPPPFTFTSLVTPWWYFKGAACALSWAFAPGPATATAWTGLVDDLKVRPPVNIAVGGVGFINAAAAGLDGEGDCSSAPLEMAGGPVTGSFDLCAGVEAAGATTWGERLRQALTVVLIAAGCWIGYHRISKSFGGKA